MIVINGNYLQDKEIFKIYVNGYIDSSSAPDFEKKVSEYIDGGVKYIIFDCKDLGFISSAGFGVFTLINKRLKTLNGKAVICNLVKEIKNVFNLLGFSMFFNIVDTESDGINVIEKHIEDVKTGQGNIFPKVIECYRCHQKLKILSPGKFRCIKCNTIMEVN